MRRLPEAVIFPCVVLVLVAAIVFLPNLTQATIYRDDWYYTLDRLKGGAQAFHEMFYIDRPARGYFFEIYYRLFGVVPAGYHAASFLLRVLLGWAGLWFFRLLFPQRRWESLAFALLLVLYPGYWRWMEGFEDQPTIASLLLQVISIALSLAAVKLPWGARKALLWAGALLSGWAYILLVDYAAGMEFFRLACIVTLAWPAPAEVPRKLVRGLLVGVRAWLPALLIPAGWLVWRLFLFTNLRPETDIRMHLETFLQSPLLGLVTLGGFYTRSVLYALFQSWTGLAFTNIFGLPARQMVSGLALSALSAGVVLLAARLWPARENSPPDTGPNWSRKALLLGLVGVLVGVLPVIVVYRWIMFQAYSHYAVPVSLAAALFVTGALGMLASRSARLAALALLVFFAAGSQYAASRAVLTEEQTISAFWQQVTWRAPGIREGTALVVSYPGFVYGEDVDAVSGPANFLYYPGPDTELPVTYPLYAAKQYAWTAQELLTGVAFTAGYRTHAGIINPAQALVISQSKTGGCVHVLDRRWPWYFFNDRELIRLAGPLSDTASILPGSSPPVLDPAIFGRLPEPGWCSVFQQAELAVQQQDWGAVPALWRAAEQAGLWPEDPLESMPFLQAAAALGDLDMLDTLIGRASVTDYERTQICGVLHGMQRSGVRIPASARRPLEERICALEAP